MVDLKNSKLFHGLPTSEFLAVQKLARLKFYEAGQTIFKQGDAGDGVYIIHEGWVEIRIMIGQQEQRGISRLGPGDFFGEMAVLDNETRSAAAVAETNASISFIPRFELLEMLERSPRLSMELIKEVSLRFREFNRQYLREVLQAERLALVGRFARSIVHDFKNPLAIIAVAAEIVSAETATPSMRQLSKQRIHTQVDRLSNMINELLEFTRGANNPNVLAPSDFNAFILQVLEEVRLEVTAKNINLVCENPPPKVRLLIDPRRLTHVIFNLVHNAVDAMPHGGSIYVRFKEHNSRIITEIEDTGTGVDGSIIGRLFEPFATFGKSHGTGLGLSICKRIIEDHKGQIFVNSDPGKGANFWFYLPRLTSDIKS